MYVPRTFASPSDAASARLIDTYGFAVLVACASDGVPMVSHVPILRDGARGVLVGHLARPNHQVEVLADCARAGREVLAVFQGPHGYISPRWYASPRNNVPTWNYAAVHVYGVPRLVDDAPSVRRIVDDLTEQYERRAWTLDTQTEDYIARQLRAIIGFEIPLARVEGKFKMSQNRNAADRDGAIAALEASERADDRELAKAMREAAGA
ncbi:MAG: FMN-binding negative transcriptional regulator [Alphaproteobacteria bacterium]|nr:FMN-binding negative transcriptional regulator [Alphaproteobacteria bacterium]